MRARQVRVSQIFSPGVQKFGAPNNAGLGRELAEDAEGPRELEGHAVTRSYLMNEKQEAFATELHIRCGEGSLGSLFLLSSHNLIVMLLLLLQAVVCSKLLLTVRIHKAFLEGVWLSLWSSEAVFGISV